MFGGWQLAIGGWWFITNHQPPIASHL